MTVNDPFAFDVYELRLGFIFFFLLCCAVCQPWHALQYFFFYRLFVCARTNFMAISEIGLANSRNMLNHYSHA